MRPALAAVISLAAATAGPAIAGASAPERPPARFHSTGAPVGDYALGVRSVQDRKFAGVIRQQFDFSCGSAALATLLRYHYDYDVGEDRAFRGMWSRGDQAQIRQLGFSLLDMKRWLASRGVQADGYKVSLDTIARTGVPGIALIAVRDYRHFVVVKGVTAGEVLLGDPSAGLVTMPRAEFAEAWNGIYFALAGDQPLAKSRFNQSGAWSSYARAPVGRGFTDPVSQQALLIAAPFRGDF